MIPIRLAKFLLATNVALDAELIGNVLNGVVNGGAGTSTPPTLKKIGTTGSVPQLARKAAGVTATAVVPASVFLKNDLLFIFCRYFFG